MMIQQFLSNKWNLIGVIILDVILLCILFSDDVFTIEERILSVLLIIALCFKSYLIGMSRGIFIELQKWSYYANLIDKESKLDITDKDDK